MGDMVIIHDDNPRMNWRVAVVEDLELSVGGDGLIS